MQAVLALQQQQQELQRQQMLQSLLLQQQALANIPGVTIGAGAGAGGVGGAPNPATKKARELYVGNLAVGVIGANEVIITGE
jgi:splicing factor U2AF subunit